MILGVEEKNGKSGEVLCLKCMGRIKILASFAS
jgi:hypothetical protein